jgi:hypothetical protein
VRKLGADIIIGVDVQDGLLDRSQLKDATKILVQINNLNSIERMQYCGYRHLHQTRYIAVCDFI